MDQGRTCLDFWSGLILIILAQDVQQSQTLEITADAHFGIKLSTWLLDLCDLHKRN